MTTTIDLSSQWTFDLLQFFDLWIKVTLRQILTHKLGLYLKCHLLSHWFMGNGSFSLFKIPCCVLFCFLAWWKEKMSQVWHAPLEKGTGNILIKSLLCGRCSTCRFHSLWLSALCIGFPISQRMTLRFSKGRCGKLVQSLTAAQWWGQQWNPSVWPASTTCPVKTSRTRITVGRGRGWEVCGVVGTGHVNTLPDDSVRKPLGGTSAPRRAASWSLSLSLEEGWLSHDSLFPGLQSPFSSMTCTLNSPTMFRELVPWRAVPVYLPIYRCLPFLPSLPTTLMKLQPEPCGGHSPARSCLGPRFLPAWGGLKTDPSFLLPPLTLWGGEGRPAVFFLLWLSTCNIKLTTLTI